MALKAEVAGDKLPVAAFLPSNEGSVIHAFGVISFITWTSGHSKWHISSLVATRYLVMCQNYGCINQGGHVPPLLKDLGKASLFV